MMLKALFRSLDALSCDCCHPLLVPSYLLPLVFSSSMAVCVTVRGNRSGKNTSLAPELPSAWAGEKTLGFCATVACELQGKLMISDIHSDVCVLLYFSVFVFCCPKSQFKSPLCQIVDLMSNCNL